jgi:hypothetical protein
MPTTYFILLFLYCLRQVISLLEHSIFVSGLVGKNYDLRVINHLTTFCAIWFVRKSWQKSDQGIMFDYQAHSKHYACSKLSVLARSYKQRSHDSSFKGQVGGHQKSSLSLLFFPLPAPAPAPAFLPLPAPFFGALSSSSESSPLAPLAGASGTLPTMSRRLSNCSSCITADFMCWERTRLEPRCLAFVALAEMRRIMNNSSALAVGCVSGYRRQRGIGKTYPLRLG